MIANQPETESRVNSNKGGLTLLPEKELWNDVRCRNAKHASAS